MGTENEQKATAERFKKIRESIRKFETATINNINTIETATKEFIQYNNEFNNKPTKPAENE